MIKARVKKQCSPEMMTSERGVRRWEWVSLGDEFGWGKLVSTARQTDPDQQAREKISQFCQILIFFRFLQIF